MYIYIKNLITGNFNFSERIWVFNKFVLLKESTFLSKT